MLKTEITYYEGEVHHENEEKYIESVKNCLENWYEDEEQQEELLYIDPECRDELALGKSSFFGGSDGI